MKKMLLFLLLALMSKNVVAQKGEYQLSSHILDVSKGMPASGVTITLEKMDEKTKLWHQVDQKVTDQNGRITDFLKHSTSNLGVYKLRYFTKAYFEKNKTQSFYPFIEVVFEISDDSHYHVPITLSAYGYATYRGN
ncbi:hydroxyisourate hydrolase [Flavobacterium sp.]|uniref:hydroxyisourate hydrolase n=1 Tax=Flavobacterium sp. TaxID=239 RepID=UPI0025F8CB7F|nr:hydroxyisourate hydrolase [Flavobacterium sp.]